MSPLVEKMGLMTNTQNTAILATNIMTCDLFSHKPALTGLILPTDHRATHVARISNDTLSVLAIPTCMEL
jgi:hypothetical protein